MKTRVIIGVIVAIILILGGAAWYVYSNSAIAAELGFRHPAPASNVGSNTGSTTPDGYPGDFTQGGFANGTIEVLSDTGFTLTLSNADTKNIDVSATTTIQNYATASSTPTTITADQLSVGEQVSVIGTPNTDGSINARYVRTGAVPVRPTGGTGGPRGASPGHIQPQ